MNDWIEVLRHWGADTVVFVVMMAVILGLLLLVSAIQKSRSPHPLPPRPREWDYRDNGGPWNRDQH